VDAEGVALASIQALYQMAKEPEGKVREIDQLKEEVQTLRKRLEKLEQTMKPELKPFIS